MQYKRRGVRFERINKKRVLSNESWFQTTKNLKSKPKTRESSKGKNRMTRQNRGRKIHSLQTQSGNRDRDRNLDKKNQIRGTINGYNEDRLTENT